MVVGVGHEIESLTLRGRKMLKPEDIALIVKKLKEKSIGHGQFLYRLAGIVRHKVPPHFFMTDGFLSASCQ